MSVIVKTECQKCEDIHEAEFDNVLVAGFKTREGKVGVEFWYHDLSLSEQLDILTSVLGSVTKQVEALEEKVESP